MWFSETANELLYEEYFNLSKFQLTGKLLNTYDDDEIIKLRIAAMQREKVLNQLQNELDSSIKTSALSIS